MIQRLQSIFLAIITMCMVAMLEGDIWIKSSPIDGQKLCTMCVWYLEIIQENTFYFPHIFMGLFANIIALLSLYTVFKHENRKLQMRLTLLNGLMLIGFIGLVIYLIIRNTLELLPSAVGQYQFKCILPIVALINVFLAYYFIKKDDRLVRSESIR